MIRRNIINNYSKVVISNSILGDNKLTFLERLLLIVIMSLCKKEGYCWATNEYFKKIFKVSKQTVSKSISSLSKNNYIVLEYDKKEKNNSKRIIRLSEVLKNDISGIQDRKQLTDIWKDRGITEAKEYAILTDEIYKEWSGMSAKEYKSFKGLRKESLRDNMSDIEIALADIGELATREIAKKKKPQGLNENMEVARSGGEVASNTRKDLENKIGESIVTSNNALNYKYIDEKELR